VTVGVLFEPMCPSPQPMRPVAVRLQGGLLLGCVLHAHQARSRESPSMLLSHLGRQSEVGEDGVRCIYSKSLALTRKASRGATPKGLLPWLFFLDDPSLELRVTRLQYMVVRVTLPEDSKDMVPLA
jgi:hypothetical protein